MTYKKNSKENGRYRTSRTGKWERIKSIGFEEYRAYKPMIKSVHKNDVDHFVALDEKLPNWRRS